MKSLNTLNEKAIENKIKAYLLTLPKCWFFKTRGGPYQTAGIPDIIGVINGRFFALEIKRQGGQATVLQTVVLHQMTKAGAVACVVDSLESAQEALAPLLEYTTPA